jgi:hypothetical protein
MVRLSGQAGVVQVLVQAGVVAQLEVRSPTGAVVLL